MKICIISGTDLDSRVAAEIAETYIKLNNELVYLKGFGYYSKGKRVKFCTKPKNYDTLNIIEYNGKDTIPDLSNYDKIIMCGISFSAVEMYYLFCKLSKDNFIWFHDNKDDLIMSLETGYYDTKGLRGTDYLVWELAWKYYFPEKKLVELLYLFLQ